jgi:hypothetical protein
MNMTKAHSLLIAACLLLPLSWGCSSDTSVAGGSEAGNARVAGGAITSDSLPAQDAIVKLRPVDYLHGDSVTSGAVGNTVTDEQGKFAFDSVPEGDYRIAIYSPHGLGASLECHVSGETPSIELQAALLDSLGGLQGVVTGPGVLGEAFRIRPYGLDKEAHYEIGTGRYRLDSLPGGVYDINLTSPSGQFAEKTLEQVSVEAGEETEVSPVRVEVAVHDDLTEWPNRIQLVLNTTVSGVPLSERILGFPLLVRLNDTTFDFASANSDGADLRFVNVSGDMLPYEIESWDSAAGNAHVWVRVDTIHPDNDTQYVTMLWGNPGAVSLSDGGSVFDTVNGYAGVWHLAQKADPDFFPDATTLRNDMTRITDRDTVVPAPGVVGDGLQFPRNYNAFLATPDAPSLRVQTFTFAAWFRRQHDNSAQFPSIISKQNWTEGKGYIFGFVHHDSVSMVTRILSGNSSNEYSDAYTDSTFDEWVHVVGTYDGDVIRMYRNGVPMDANTVGRVDILYDTTSVQLGRAFKGSLDEVRICGTPRSAEWVKLMYESQRVGQIFVRFQ